MGQSKAKESDCVQPAGLGMVKRESRAKIPAAAVSAVRVVPGDRANLRDRSRTWERQLLSWPPPKVDAPSLKYHDGTSNKYQVNHKPK